MNFLREIFDDNKDEIKMYAGWAIAIACAGGVIWVCNHVL